MKLKTLLLYVTLLHLCLSSLSQTRSGLFDSLYLAIEKTNSYDALKKEKIESIRNDYRENADKSLPTQYDYNLRLYDEYKVYLFDSAFVYAVNLEKTASTINDSVKTIQAKIKLSFVLVSAGLYKEADDVMNAIDINGMPSGIKAEYYLLKARYYYDLADYDDDTFYAPRYTKKATSYLDSALVLFPTGSFEDVYYNGLRKMKRAQIEEAYNCFQLLTNRKNLTEHQTAIVYSTLSFIYNLRGNTDSAIDCQVKAAIADIKSSTKETFATLNLSQLLFKKGDFKNASAYIQKAVEDASFYGARQRKVQVSAIMPIIQSSNLNYINSQRRIWIIYAAIITVILIAFVLLAVVIYKQNKKLNHSKQLISEAYSKLNDTNSQLKETNHKLTDLNLSLEEANMNLTEANKIKEEYVGYFFTAYSSFFHRIERFKEMMEKKIHSGRLDELRFTLNSINVKTEQEEILKNFDRAFIKLFPGFVREFNALLHEEDQILLHENELLNTDLRIFALIRLGIKENDKIAEILEYSVKSIYAYKTRVRNKAKFSKEDFDKKVMQIKSV